MCQYHVFVCRAGGPSNGYRAPMFGRDYPPPPPPPAFFRDRMFRVSEMLMLNDNLLAGYCGSLFCNYE